MLCVYMPWRESYVSIFLTESKLAEEEGKENLPVKAKKPRRKKKKNVTKTENNEDSSVDAASPAGAVLFLMLARVSEQTSVFLFQSFFKQVTHRLFSEGRFIFSIDLYFNEENSCYKIHWQCSND